MTSQESNASATAAHATLPQTPSVADARQTARRRVLAVLTLVALALIWGYAWVVMKVALRYVQPLTFAALRTFLGAVALFALLCVLRRPLRPMAVRWTVAVGLLQTTGFLAFSTLAPLQELERVARIYSDAFYSHQPPTKAVAQQLGITYSAAAKRIATCRRSGLLGSAERGKASVGALIGRGSAATLASRIAIDEEQARRREQKASAEAQFIEKISRPEDGQEA